MAFALRVRAAVELDIEPRELEAGMRLIAAGGTGAFRPEIFLADAIENGAGFVTRLADAQRFDDLLNATRQMIASQWEDPARHDCEGSCPRCLRDFSNTPYHPVLDWRLAADLLDILITGQLARDRSGEVAVDAAHRRRPDVIPGGSAPPTPSVRSREDRDASGRHGALWNPQWSPVEPSLRSSRRRPMRPCAVGISPTRRVSMWSSG
jgi:hypothetical protein